MILQTAVKLLDKRLVILFTTINHRQPISALCSLHSSAESLLPENILYYGTVSELKNSHIRTANYAGLFLLQNDTAMSVEELSDCHNVFIVEDFEEYETCLDILRQGLAEDARFEQGHQKVLNLIASNRPLATIADEIAFQYGHYIDIIDNSLNILALSESVMPPTPNLLEDHRIRLVQPNVVQYLRLSGNLDQMRSTREPILVEDEPRNTYAWTLPIFVGATLTAGYICIFVKKEEYFSPVAKFHMLRTAQLLSLEMQKNQTASLNKSTWFTHLLTSMLQGVPASITSYEDRFRAFNYPLRKYKRVLLLQLDPHMPETLDVNILSSTLQTQIYNSVYAVYENSIVFLSSADKLSDFHGSDMLVSEYLSSSRLKMGISSIFESELSVKDHYQQAKSALRLGNQFFPVQNLHTYDAVRTLDAVDSLGQVRNLQLLCYPPLMRLMETDREGAPGCLAETLYRYLANGQSAAKTCDELYLHRNGLYYRLQKIREIMDCEFTDLNVLTQIALTFTILRYLGQLPWE